MNMPRGNPSDVDAAACRIVSLLPSATEIVTALGLRECLAGRSHECDFPPDVTSLPICCQPTIDVLAPSGQIHAQVEQRLASAISLFQLDTDRIATLRPTHILTQMQCEVCAVSEQEVQAAVAALADSKPQILSLSPGGLSDLWHSIHDVASALGISDRGCELVERLQARLNSIRNRAAQTAHKPRVVCIEWLDPLMTAGNWIPELVEIAGGQNLVSVAGEHSPWMTWDQLFDADPDVIVILPCGFDLARTRSEAVILSTNPQWKRLRAAATGSVFLADGHHYFNRPGPRLVESAEILAEILQPEVFPPAQENVGWVRM
ncbi:MAG: cobalamin-binding protein [Planctomycetaceae bacterium]